MPPFLSAVTSERIKLRPIRFLVYWAVIYGTLAGAASLEGKLTGAMSWKTLFSDLGQLFLQREPTPGASSSDFPLLRDYASLVHAWMIAAIAIWAGDLLRGYSTILPRMLSAKSIKISDANLLQSRLASLSARLKKGEIHIAAVVLAALLTVLGSLAYQRQGIYFFFSPETENAARFARTSYENWWARTFRFSSFVWIFWALVGNYLNVWISYASVEVVVFFWRMRQAVTLTIDPRNLDGSWGWAPVVEIISIGRKLAIAASIGLAAIALIANPSGFNYLILFPATFIIAILLFMVPNKLYREAKDYYVENMTVNNKVEQMLASLQIWAMPDKVVRVRDFVYQVILTAVPGVIAIAQVAKDAIQ